MADFECVCSVVKGERENDYGEDCYCWYPKPNYDERIVRCRDCKQNYQPWPDGSTIPCPWSKSLDGFCAWGEPNE